MNRVDVFLEACEKGDYSRVADLLRQGVDPNVANDERETGFLWASEHGHNDILDLLAQHGADPKHRSFDGRTAVFYAAAGGQVHTIMHLVKRYGMDINETCGLGRTALIAAAENGHDHVIDFLIANGANPNVLAYGGHHAALCAMSGGHAHTVRHLVGRYGLDVNHRDKYGATVLLVAAERGDPDLIDFLVDHGANVNVTDHDGRGALHYSIRAKRFDNACHLITHYHLDPNQQDENGVTPVFWAAEYGENALIDMLVHHGADLRHTDHHGNGVLAYAVRSKQHQTARHLLAAHGVDPNAADRDGVTSFMIAAQNNDIAMLDLLVRFGADCHRVDNNCSHALHYAVKYRQLAAARHLLGRYGLDPNVEDRHGRTPILIAAEKGDKMMINMLECFGGNPYHVDRYGNSVLHYVVRDAPVSVMAAVVRKYGGNINVMNRQGRTPLMDCLMNRKYHTVKAVLLLLGFGANPNIVDSEGYTPLKLACLKNCHDLIRLLVKYGAIPFLGQKKDCESAKISSRKVTSTITL